MLIKILNSIRLRDISLGLKKGYNIPTLPHKLENLYSNIYIRIFRVIGGLCLLLVLTSNYSLFPVYLHTLIKIIGFIQSIQIVIIFIIKAIYASYTLIYKSKDFEVRNSPLNTYASYIARAIYCAKVGCAITGGTASVIAAGASYDQVLEAAGREKVFVPLLGSMYKSVFGESVQANAKIQSLLNQEAVKTAAQATDTTQNTATMKVQEMVEEYNKMSTADRVKYLNAISSEVNKSK